MKITPSRLLWLWLQIGTQSFGGGAATFYMIYQTFVIKNRLIPPEDYTRMRAMVEVVPGMNILAVTTLIGWRFFGWLGVAIALFGLLLPSVSITIVMTALYLQIQSLSFVQAAVKGIVPVLVGVSFYTMGRVAQPVLQLAKRDGIASLVLCMAILLGSGLILLFYPTAPVFGVYFGAGIILALYNTRQKQKHSSDTQK